MRLLLYNSKQGIKSLNGSASAVAYTKGCQVMVLYYVMTLIKFQVGTAWSDQT